jgi:hypothetical protein
VVVLLTRVEGELFMQILDTYRKDVLITGGREGVHSCFHVSFLENVNMVVQIIQFDIIHWKNKERNIYILTAQYCFAILYREGDNRKWREVAT